MLEVPTIRIVRTLDPNGYVRGPITMYEVVDIFDEYDELEPEYAAYTEREAQEYILTWLDG